jgi:outer membrane receptor protein involved in Fe transport
MNVNHFRLALAISLILAISEPALAQTTELEEVTVTAQKREQSLQDVGVSVTALPTRSISLRKRPTSVSARRRAKATTPR